MMKDTKSVRNFVKWSAQIVYACFKFLVPYVHSKIEDGALL